MNKDGRANIKRKRWFYTWNNPNRDADQHHASLAAVDPSYHVFQRERGESGTPHFQGYLEFPGPRSWKQLMACNPQVVWQPAQGTGEQATAYCTKAETREEGPWTFGDMASAGRTTGCSADFISSVKAGKRLRDVHDAFPEEVRKYPRYYQTLRALYPPPPRDGPPEVILLIGPPGTGKSRYVRDNCRPEDLFFKPVDANMWMDGYDLHPDVLLDDFAGAANHIALVNLLQLLDRYLVQVPIKGGFTWWQPDRIFITTNIHPRDWYDWTSRTEQWPALSRRITCVMEFHEEGCNDLHPKSEGWNNFWSLTLPGRLDVPVPASN